MKMNYKNKLFAFASVGIIFLTACDKQTIDYEPNPVGPNDYAPAYFKIQPTQDIAVGSSDGSYTFVVYRADLTAPSTATLTWSGDTQIFDLPTEVEFGPDDYLSEVTLTYDNSDMEAEISYNLTASLGYKDTPNSQNSLDLVFKYYPMTEWEPFGYDEALGRDGIGYYVFTAMIDGVEDPVLVMTRHSELYPEQVEYQFQWLIDNNTPADKISPFNPEVWETFMTAKSDDGGESIYVPTQRFFLDHPTYGPIYITTASLIDEDWSLGPSYFDDVTGTFWLDIQPFVSAGYFSNSYEYCVLNGYLDTNDYTVTVTDQGMVTIQDSNYEIVNISWTEAVSLVQYTTVETSSISENGEVSEELLEELVEKIADGSVTSTPADEMGIYSFSFPSKGDYTVVAVGFKEENDGSYTWKSYGYTSFEYVTPDPNEGWNILGYVEYTDGYMCSSYLIAPLTYYVEIQESEEWEEYYRLVDPYGADFPFNKPGQWDESVISYLYVDAYYPEFVYIEDSPQTLDWGTGNLICSSIAYDYLQGGSSQEEITEMGYNGTYSNKQITFPFRTLMKSLNGGSSWTFANLAYDIPSDGQDYLRDENGEYVAPFLIDFNTLTDDPLAPSSTAAVKANVAAKAKVMAQAAALNTRSNNAHKAARVVKFKSSKVNLGRRQVLDRKPKSFKF